MQQQQGRGGCHRFVWRALDGGISTQHTLAAMAVNDAIRQAPKQAAARSRRIPGAATAAHILRPLLREHRAYNGISRLVVKPRPQEPQLHV